jgi:cold shock protein
MKGIVKFFNHQRGFGFLDVDGVDYFVHITDVEGEMLLGGEEVEFKAVEGHKGLQAIEVSRLNPPQMLEEAGEVRFYNAERGFGFIGRKGKADVFAHFSDFEDISDPSEITEGLKVYFVVRSGRDGRDRAYQIRTK